mmetsp:Transcript_47765/g.117028  ORF Transcript_47765/g.117028 Transcript_47765/m.117028 type:complete len:87 (+) Transcript_47765:73-333(+)
MARRRAYGLVPPVRIAEQRLAFTHAKLYNVPSSLSATRVAKPPTPDDAGLVPLRRRSKKKKLLPFHGIQKRHLVGLESRDQFPLAP